MSKRRKCRDFSARLTAFAVVFALLPISAANAQRPATAPASRAQWEYAVASTIYTGTGIHSLRWFEGDSTITVEGNDFKAMGRRIAGRDMPGDGFHTWYNALGEKGWELVLCRESPTGPIGRDVTCTFKRRR